MSIDEPSSPSSPPALQPSFPTENSINSKNYSTNHVPPPILEPLDSLCINRPHTPQHQHLLIPTLEPLEASYLPSPRLPDEIVERIIPTLSLITIASMAGVVIRVELVQLFTFDTSLMTIPLLVVQFIGCVIMGWVAQWKPWLINRHGSLYSALSSGLCGSITTFSSWSLQMFQQMSGFDSESRFSPKPQPAILNLLTHLFLTLAVSFSGLEMGSWLGNLFRNWLDPNRPYLRGNLVQQPLHELGRLPDRKLWFFHSLGFMIVGVGLPLFLLIGGLVHDWGRLAISCALAPAGAMMRYIMARWNYSKFPRGTLLANVVGCLVLGLVTYLMLIPDTNFTLLSLYGGLADGFCGCLSTVSTFTMELKNIPRPQQKLRYLVVSIIMGQLAILLTFFLPIYLSLN